MSENGFLQIIIYLVVVIALVKPVGWYMARVYEGKSCGLDKVLKPVERGFYYLCGIESKQEMNWRQYAIAMLLFNLIGIIIVYFIQRWQMFLPLNPQQFPRVTPNLSFNTAVSFVTNTNWQAYSGESTLSYFSQMIGLTVQNFVSAASGMSVLVALIRGITRHETTDLGNFWVDTVRGVLYILLPLSILLALALVSQGVIQNFHPYQKTVLLQPLTYQKPLLDANEQLSKSKFQKTLVTEQTIPMGPVASQVAIKQLGTNGGGYFNTNSAHPFENPTPLTNFLEMLAILLIPAALCYTFGVMVRDTRQGFAILIAMLLVFVPLIGVTIYSEQNGNPALKTMDIELRDHNFVVGNMEGKETRFGIVNSGLWATVTTATGNGSVNAMLDSFTPLGGLIPLWLMQLSESIFGGVGSGLYQMLIFIIVTVFIAGLMVGRTPEYLGKKIESFEMKMASFVILIMPLMVLLCAAIAVVIDAGKSAIANPGAHGFSEILYAFSSMGNNNGSAFAGLNANSFFYNIVGGLAMLIGRYWIAIPVLAIAGSLAGKKSIPVSLGTLPTDTPLFVFLLLGVVIIIGALTFLPALALGPIAEQLMMMR